MLKSGETPPEVYNELWRTITAGLTWRGELVNRKKNGDLFWENVIISPVRDDNGRLTHFIALKEDITHRKRNEEMLIDTNADIERMLFAASHDLQEPVRSIVTFSQLLQREAGNNLNERAEASLGFILEATKQLHLLIKGLVDYSRSTRPVAAFVPVNCATVVQRAIADCRDMAPQAAPIIDVGELPTIMGDPVLLMMLFVNLIGNAIKYAREGVVPTIKVSASQDGTGWRIAIADNGIGIEADYLKDLIRPFSRLHSRSTHPGAGLGLASSQKIAKTHGGRLWLSATPGHGTTAFLWLPAMSGRG
jgi:light-regulated signal transduction histidine kinase (bacteriophytochrome)